MEPREPRPQRPKANPEPPLEVEGGEVDEAAPDMPANPSGGMIGEGGADPPAENGRQGGMIGQG